MKEQKDLKTVLLTQNTYQKGGYSLNPSYRRSVMDLLRFNLEKKRLEVCELASHNYGISIYEAHLFFYEPLVQIIDTIQRNRKKWFIQKSFWRNLFDVLKGIRIQRYPRGTVLIFVDSPIRFWASIAAAISVLAAGNSVVFTAAYDLIEVEEKILTIFEAIFTEELWYNSHYSSMENESVFVDLLIRFPEDTENSTDIPIASTEYFEVEEESSDIVIASSAQMKDASINITQGFFDHILSPAFGPRHIFVQESVKDDFQKALGDLTTEDLNNSRLDALTQERKKSFGMEEDFFSEIKIQTNLELIKNRISSFDDWEDLLKLTKNRGMSSVYQFYGDEKEDGPRFRSCLKGSIVLDNCNLLEYNHLISQATLFYKKSSLTQEIYYRNSLFKRIRKLRNP